MLNLIGKALTGMVLDRDAREAMAETGGLASTIQGSADARLIMAAIAAAQATARIGSTPLTPPSASSSPALIAAALAAAAAATAQPAQSRSAPTPAAETRARAPQNPEREALIRNAMQVRSAKRTILDNLPPEQRAKLVALATRLFNMENKSGA